MRKLILLATVLAAGLIAAVPAMAQPETTMSGPPGNGPAAPLSDSSSCGVLNAAPADPSCGGSALPEEPVPPPPVVDAPVVDNAIEESDADTGLIEPPVTDGLEIQDNAIDDDSADEAGDAVED